ncbi:LLM class flavin-dependent oxidoreductase [Agrobacterium burrii]
MNIAILVQGAGNHQGAWRRANSKIEETNKPDFYVNLAQACEAAKLDAIFFADIPFLDPKIFEANPVPNAFEPLMLTAHLAAFTSRIGLVSSVSTSFSEPYTIARQFASLDRISSGRAGWNIVTSAAGEKNYGFSSLPDQSLRYARAAEFIEITKRLWDSWDEKTLKIDRASGIFADIHDIRPTDFHGEYFNVAGPLNIQRPPQGWPVLFQAGASTTGMDFATRTAESIFTAQQSLEDSLHFARSMRNLVNQAGRDPRRVKILLGITPIIGATEAEALAVERELAGLIDLKGSLRKLSSYMPGVDLSSLDLDKPIPRNILPDVSQVQGRQSRYKLFVDLTLKEGWTLRQLVTLTSRSDGHWTVTGSPEQIADLMTERFLADACDGYVVMATYHPEGSDLFLKGVVPILQERGIFRKEYTGSTLREHLGLDVPSRRPLP